jgi:hypothetical protein
VSELHIGHDRLDYDQDLEVQGFVYSDRYPGDQRDELIRTLQESYSNDHFPADGRIYRKIRSYQGYPHRQSSNKAAENYWWAVLESSPGSRKGGRSRKGGYLKSLLKHKLLRERFDDLLSIDGLWDDMNIGVLHKLLAMRCDEVKLYKIIPLCSLAS